MRKTLTACVVIAGLSACTAGGSSVTPKATPTAGRSGSDLGRGSTSDQILGENASVELRIAPPKVPYPKAPRLVLFNKGQIELGYGYGYKVERRIDGSWKPVRNRGVYLLPALSLPPGARSDPEKIAVYRPLGSKPTPLRPGLYRVTKSLDISGKDTGTGNRRTFNVRARFRITP